MDVSMLSFSFVTANSMRNWRLIVYAYSVFTLAMLVTIDCESWCSVFLGVSASHVQLYVTASNAWQQL